MRFLMHHMGFLAIGITCAVAWTGTGAARVQSPRSTQNQQPTPPATIRVRVRLIPVDVIVTDDRDRPVVDLKKEDFQIFENGQPQEIRHFSVQSLTAAAAKSGPPPTLRAVPTLELAPQQARTFMILLGRGRHQAALKSLDHLIQFVRNGLLPQDRVAVFAYNRATDFTTDHEKIVRVLERYKEKADEIEAHLELYGALLARFAKWYQPKIDYIIQGDAGLASRQLPPAETKESSSVNRSVDRAKEILLRGDVNERKNAASGGVIDSMTAAVKQFDVLEVDALTLSLPFDEFVLRSRGGVMDMSNIFTCIQYMRYMEGEKHLLFFTEFGLMLPF
jgi:hypothetical protein